MGRKRASGQMRIAVALRYRLPRYVRCIARAGVSRARLISEITWRTKLVDDDVVTALIDTAIAERAARWGPLSDAKLTASIEAVIERFDPGGGAAGTGGDPDAGIPYRCSRRPQ